MLKLNCLPQITSKKNEGLARDDDMNGQKVENVTLKQLTRFYFTNHFLEQKKARNILDVIGPICGLHGQLPSSPYTALWNRIESFEP